MIFPLSFPVFLAKFKVGLSISGPSDHKHYLQQNLALQSWKEVALGWISIFTDAVGPRSFLCCSHPIWN